jgi:hypothetical protein
MQLFRRIITRVKAWINDRRSRPVITPLSLGLTTFSTAIHRDVTATGVRVYSLCCSCGIRLEASATLCEECAQKRSRPARPY